jgi:hypothetical protein
MYQLMACQTQAKKRNLGNELAKKKGGRRVWRSFTFEVMQVDSPPPEEAGTPAEIEV